MDNSSKFYLINTKEYLNLELHPGVNKDYLKKSQLMMTEMLRSFDKICKKYNLKYWCVGGTFIGTIRHHGWIPYDGDIDICMLDKDYKIFCSKVNELASNIWLQSVSTDSLYNSLLPKIRHLYSNYSEDINSRSHQGLQIDIYVYRQIGDNLISLSYDSTIPNSRNCCYPDIFNMKYNEIFPLNKGKFEGIDVYIPNNYKDFSIKYWGDYPPVLLPIKERYPHEGRMNPNNARDIEKKLYPSIYNSLKEWKILIVSIDKTNSNLLNLIEDIKRLKINIEIIDGYNWKINNINEFLEKNDINTVIDYTNSSKIKDQICYFLSNLKAWRYIANSSEDINYIILRDDVIISDDLNFEHLTNIFKYLPNYDYVNLYSDPLNIDDQSKSTQDFNLLSFIKNINYQSKCVSKDFFTKGNFNYDTCSYTITKKFANELIKINTYYSSINDMLNKEYLQSKNIFITLKSYFNNK